MTLITCCKIPEGDGNGQYPTLVQSQILKSEFSDSEIETMNEQRKPTETWFKRLPVKVGQKASRKCNLKIELFPLYLWGRWWSPGCHLFSPKLPLRSEDRIEFWQIRYRIRVNGKWVGSRAKYVSYTKQMILDRYFNGK